MKALTSISLIAMLVAVSLAPASAGVIYEGGAPPRGDDQFENPARQRHEFQPQAIAR